MASETSDRLAAWEAAAKLSEFEGALLSSLGRLQPCTAYQVRVSFQTSPSADFRGSAGAVYPALRRLRSEGLVAAAQGETDGRGSTPLVLTAQGAAVLAAWTCDPVRAAEPGMDPFRARVSQLEFVAEAERRPFLLALAEVLQSRIDWMETYAPAQDPINRRKALIDQAQAKTRLAWVRAALDGEV